VVFSKAIMNSTPVLVALLNLGTSFEFLATVGSIGWLLTVYCLIDKFDKKKDKLIHLLSDIVNATFAVITLVAAISIAVNLSIRLPDVIVGRVAQEIRKATPPPSLTLAEEIIKLNRAGKLDNASLTDVLQRQFKGLKQSDSSLIVIVDGRRFRIINDFRGTLDP
jgi:hypothetical protein